MTDQSANGVLVCYTVDNCPPFLAMETELRKVDEAFGNRLKIKYVDAWEDPEGIVRLGFVSLPALVLYINGDVRLRLQGFQWADQLARKIAAAFEEGGEVSLIKEFEQPGPLARLLRMFRPELRRASCQYGSSSSGS